VKLYGIEVFGCFIGVIMDGQKDEYETSGEG